MDIDITKPKSTGSKEDHFYDLLNAASGGGGSARTEAKSLEIGDISNRDNILPSYDFQNPAPRMASNGTIPSPTLSGASGVGLSRPTNITSNSSTSIPPPLQLAEHQDNLVVAAVDAAMKKYADNMVKILDGINGRLEDLSQSVGQIESQLQQNCNALANSHGELDGRTRGIEHTLYEVQRSLQVLRDKQEIAEELQKLQLGKTKESLVPAPSPTAEEQKPVIDKSQLGLQLVPSVSVSQGPTAPPAPSAPSPTSPAMNQIAAPSQPSPYPSQPGAQLLSQPHTQPSMAAPALEQQQSQMPGQQTPPVQQLAYGQAPQGQPGMQPQPPMQYQPSGQMAPPSQGPPPQQQQQQQPQILPPGGQYAQQAPPSYSQQPQQLPPPHPPAAAYQQPPQMPPQYMQGGAHDGSGPYVPPGTYPPMHRQPVPQGVPQPPPHGRMSVPEGPPRVGAGGYPLAPQVPQSGGGGGPPPMPQMYEPPPPPGAGYPPASAHQYHPASGGGGGGGYSGPQPGGGYGSSYPSLRRPLQMAQPVDSAPASASLQQQQPANTAGAVAGGGAPQLSTSRLPIDRVIDDVAKMGFSKEEVAAVVKKLTENGQSVELNVILDKLVQGGARPIESGQKPSSGWFGGR